MSTKLITATNFRLLSRINLLKNPWFELPSGGGAPTDWLVGGTNVNGNRIVTAVTTPKFPRGSGHPTQSLKMQKDTGAANCSLGQTTAAGVVVLNKPWIVACAVRPNGPGQPSFTIQIDAKDAASATTESVSGALASGFTIGGWNLVYEVLTPTNAASTKFAVSLINATIDSEFIYVAYLHFGLLSDFSRKVAMFAPKDRPRVALNRGDGAFRTVETATPEASLRFGFNKNVHIFEDSADETAWLDWYSHARHGNPFTIWREANKWTNAKGHFRDCILQNEFTADFEGGVSRYPVEADAVAPLEQYIQDLVTQ